MKTTRTYRIGLSVLTMLAVLGQFLTGTVSGAEPAPAITGISQPQAGDMQILFKGGTGPFTVQKRLTLDTNAVWLDIPTAKVTSVNTGTYVAWIPMGEENAAFYRVVSAGETIVELKGWTIGLKASTPTNGVYFVVGESPVITVTVLDNFAQGMTKTNFSTFGLYMYGPEDPLKTVAASKLLNASTNRSASVHHYVDLKSNTNVVINGNTFTYLLKPVTDEAPGTYTIGVRAMLAADGIQTVIKYATVQIGTSVVESKVFATSKCAACHLGPVSGKIYFAHTDVSSRNVKGDWARDIEPDKSCKLCHNNDGYAAFTDPAGLSIGVTNRVPDHIVRRVHSIHMGEELKNYWNTNSTNGVFRDYTGVVFPADVRNCTKCHVDDRWKTKPSQLACGACHDNVYFGSAATPTNLVAHAGGPQANDQYCALCHSADTGSFAPVSVSHLIPPLRTNAIDITLTAPANGAYYVAGERPVVSLVFKNDAGNSIGDHTVVTTTNFSTANFFVYGPRSRALPVLTSTAKLGMDTRRASVTCATNGPWNINGLTFTVAINNSAPTNITIVGTAGAVTAAQVVASLNPVITNLNGGAIATVSSSTKVMIKTLIRGVNARIAIYNGPVTTAMGWKAKGVVLEPDVAVAAIFYANNDLRPITVDPLDFNDPMVTRTTTNILYQLDDVAGLAPGTYNIHAYYLPVTGKIVGITNLTGIGQLRFQVGTNTVEKKVATNCADCHGTTIFHLDPGPIHAAPFDTDYCTACHDYGHFTTGDLFKNQGGTSLSGWSGFGAMPIVRRIHGVHRARYLEHSEEIYANATKETFGEIIFPQDIRNCTKCHAETTTWKEKPARMACLACHDSDEAKVHGKLMTYMPDPNDPYGPTAIETCVICHGKGTEFSPDKVHNISDPYVPPYPREPAE